MVNDPSTKHRLEEETTTTDSTEMSTKRAKLETDITDRSPNIGSLPASSPTARGPVSKPAVQKRDAAGWPKSRKGKEKNTTNTGRKSRRGTRNDSAVGDDAGSVNRGARYPKRQCAVLMSYCGTGCSGMQIQKNARTIEGILFQALVKAGAVSEDNADDAVKVNLGRAARTDAGVHAAGNVVSMKLITVRPDVTDMLGRINEELPPEIRVWGYVRVQNSFNARIQCDSRKYTYYFPTYLLLPPKPQSALIRALQRYESSDSATMSELHPFWETTSEAHEEDLRRKRAWRVPKEQVDQLREAAKKFEGTHNFHNFTLGRDFKDRSSQRHMKKIELSDPVVYGETEWISVLFHGQSFMLHQRKMISSLVLSCRTSTSTKIIDELYGPQLVLIPKMPSLGLLLEYPIFDSYNGRVAAVNASLKPTDPEYRPPIDFEQYSDSIQEFKQNFIYNNMRKIEDEFGVFDAWIRSIDNYGGDDLLWLNKAGIIPSAAEVKKGDRRENPFKEKSRFDSTAFPAAGENDKQLFLDEDAFESDTEIDKDRLLDAEG